MVAAFGSVWSLRGNGDVIRIDPESGRVDATIANPYGFKPPLCQGIGASEDAIWACPAHGRPPGTVVGIDPETNEVTSTLATRKIADQGRLISSAGKLWLLTGSGEQLTGIDLRTEEPASKLRLRERACSWRASPPMTTRACGRSAGSKESCFESIPPCRRSPVRSSSGARTVPRWVRTSGLLSRAASPRSIPRASRSSPSTSSLRASAGRSTRRMTRSGCARRMVTSSRGSIPNSRRSSRRSRLPASERWRRRRHRRFGLGDVLQPEHDRAAEALRMSRS